MTGRGIAALVAARSRLRPDHPRHGLHYVGDKLGLIARAASWLTPAGRVVANLDRENLKLAEGQPAGRRWVADLRGCGLEYDRKRRLVICRGKTAIGLPVTSGPIIGRGRMTPVSPPWTRFTRH